MEDEKILKSLAAKEVFGWVRFSKNLLTLAMISIFMSVVLTAISLTAGTILAGITITLLAVGLRKSMLEYNRLNEKYKIVQPNPIMEYLKQMDKQRFNNNGKGQI